MLGLLLAVSFTFTATATGVEKGTPLEFVFAGKNTDRDYETMFLLDEPIDDVCRRMESAGLRRGKPTDRESCRLWPVGCRLAISPSIDKFVVGNVPEWLPAPVPIYTGGLRLTNDVCDAVSNMPASFFSLYSLEQSPIVFDGIFEQGVVYGCFTAGVKLEKGCRVCFTVSWDDSSMPLDVGLVVKPGNGIELLNNLKEQARNRDLNVVVEFSPDVSVEEAVAFSRALSTIDSRRIKINGSRGIFYRSFLPMDKWLNRKERLTQPFELTLSEQDKLVVIDEDWNVDGIDPKLTPREISFEDARTFGKIDTCFVFARSNMKLAQVAASMSKLKGCRILNWYVFQDNPY